jgi:hypothetical protein
MRRVWRYIAGNRMHYNILRQHASVNTMHDTKYKNLTLADVIEDDEWKSGYRPVPQTVVD